MFKVWRQRWIFPIAFAIGFSSQLTHLDRRDRPCDYSYPSAGEGDLDDLRSRVQELEEAVARLSGQALSSVSGPEIAMVDISRNKDNLLEFRSKLLFLDSDLLEYCSSPPNSYNAALPPEISHMLRHQSEVQRVQSIYFETIHKWIPIIGKVKFQKLVIGSKEELRSDLVLLVLCMKLIQEVPVENSSNSSELYTTVKQACAILELADCHSLSKLQATLLIAVYEIGHALYPAAYMTVASCARQGTILGIHNAMAPSLYRKSQIWTDWEEKNRVWWLVITLDRSIRNTDDGRHSR